MSTEYVIRSNSRKLAESLTNQINGKNVGLECGHESKSWLSPLLCDLRELFAFLSFSFFLEWGIGHSVISTKVKQGHVKVIMPGT